MILWFAAIAATLFGWGVARGFVNIPTSYGELVVGWGLLLCQQAALPAGRLRTPLQVPLTISEAGFGD